MPSTHEHEASVRSGDSGRMRVMLGDALVLGLVAAGLTASCFAGFGLGDDAAYSTLVSGLDEGYPPVVGANVFASRPLLLFLISQSLKVFGHTEWAFVLPVTAAAILAVLATYFLTTLVATRRAGWLAGGALALSPLHLAYATTLCNDIIGSALLAMGAALVLASTRARRPVVQRVVALVGGVVAGSSLGVKLSFGLLALPLLWLSFVFVLRARARTSLVCGLCGYGVAAAALLLFFWLVAGHALAGARTEWTFNRTFILPQLSRQPLADVLLFYPSVASGLRVWGPQPMAWSPTGLFFPLVGVAVCDALVRRQRASRLVAACLVGAFAVLEFWPLQILPTYVPIHRLPRFLYPVLVPGAVLIGVAASQWVGRGRAGRVLVGLTAAAYVASSLSIAARAVSVHNDCMRDIRFSADLALHASGAVVLDSEMEPYLRFRAGGEATAIQVLPLGSAWRAPVGSLVFVGGSRRPELDPAFAQSTVPPSPPSGWIKVADMPGAIRPWRLAKGAVYLVSADSSPVSEMPSACPAGRRWTLQDVVDVGNRESERQHTFSIGSQSWAGSRTLSVGDGAVWDDGRAFTGYEAFRVTVRERGSDVCVVKRLDPGVALQRSRWEMNGRELALTAVEQRAAGQWETLSFIVPGSLVESDELSLVERFVGSTLDVNAFRVEIYQ